MQDSCIEGMKVSEEAIARADTRNVSFDECDWTAQASPDYEPTMEMEGM